MNPGRLTPPGARHPTVIPGLLQRQTSPRIRRDGMGPRNPTDSVRKQSRPARLPLCSLFVWWFRLCNSPYRHTNSYCKEERIVFKVGNIFINCLKKETYYPFVRRNIIRRGRPNVIAPLLTDSFLSGREAIIFGRVYLCLLDALQTLRVILFYKLCQ